MKHEKDSASRFCNGKKSENNFRVCINDNYNKHRCHNNNRDVANITERNVAITVTLPNEAEEIASLSLGRFIHPALRYSWQ